MCLITSFKEIQSELQSKPCVLEKRRAGLRHLTLTNKTQDTSTKTIKRILNSNTSIQNQYLSDGCANVLAFPIEKAHLSDCIAFSKPGGSSTVLEGHSTPGFNSYSESVNDVRVWVGA